MANTTDISGIEGIAHIAFRVRDMQKSLDFYCNLLGFKHAFTLRNDEGKPQIEYLKAGDNQFIELFYGDPAGPRVTPRATNNHICLSVADIHETARALEDRGIELVIPVRGREGANWQCWCRDPDENYIEFMYIHPDSFQATS
jgi:lactoylglutathione lyase